MDERLLTIDEINSILKDSTDPKYQIENLLHLGGQLTSIQRISKKSGLILIKGNESTGFDHIMVRHHPTSKAGHWIDEVKLDNPSRFSLGTVPIYDFLHIADEIFKTDNKVTDDRNKKSEIFDLFIGKYTDRKSRTMNYKLLLYKDTLIIHNLIPDKKTFNKKKVIDLRQGFSSASSDVMRGLHTCNVPYYDHLNIERAKIIVRLQTHNGREDWNIQINNKNGAPIYTHLAVTKTVNSYLEMPFRMTSLDFQEDLSEIEKTLKKLLTEMG